MTEAYVTTPYDHGRQRGGGLAGIHPTTWAFWPGADCRTDRRPRRRRRRAIAGCTTSRGGQAGNIARLSWLVSGYPEEVPGARGPPVDPASRRFLARRRSCPHGGCHRTGGVEHSRSRSRRR